MGMMAVTMASVVEVAAVATLRVRHAVAVVGTYV